jgi:hypothetical protein
VTMDVDPLRLDADFGRPSASVERTGHVHRATVKLKHPPGVTVSHSFNVSIADGANAARPCVRRERSSQFILQPSGVRM